MHTHIYLYVSASNFLPLMWLMSLFIHVSKLSY